MHTTPEYLGKYQIKSVLGQGAMGVVYSAFDPVIERTVAIKVLHPHHCQGKHGAELTKRFKREAQAAARCLHANIVTIFDYGNHQECDYIVMEYVEGEELSHFLHSADKLTIDEALFIIQAVLHALIAAHKHHIVHRDIKPANIILLNNGEVKVADFGVALLDQSDLTLVGDMVGTPNYMSPEGLRGEAVNHQADIYSTGMVLLETLTNARLTAQQLYTLPITDFIDDVFLQHSYISHELQTIIRTALSPNLDERYSSALLFLTDIENLATVEQNLNATITAKAAIQVKSQQLNIPDDVLSELKNDLSSYLGPIADHIIRKTITQTNSAQEFMQAIAKHITNDAERLQFIETANKKLNIQPSQSSLSIDIQAPLTKDQAAATIIDKVTPEQLQELTLLLAYYLGPIASHQVKFYAKKCNNYDTLTSQLALLIKSDQEQKSFIQKLNKHTQ